MAALHVADARVPAVHVTCGVEGVKPSSHCTVQLPPLGTPLAVAVLHVMWPLRRVLFAGTGQGSAAIQAGRVGVTAQQADSVSVRPHTSVLGFVCAAGNKMLKDVNFAGLECP